uniref:Uncharacterized protein n=1 Tax=Setaria italica TaxID=4555 RepID=K3Z1L1_SETIT
MEELPLQSTFAVIDGHIVFPIKAKREGCDCILL